jgi:hypothetical protein
MADAEYIEQNQSQDAAPEEETKPNRGRAEEDIISLLVEYPASQYCKYKIKRTTKFEKLMRAFFSQNHLSSEGGLRFHFDGVRVQAGSQSVCLFVCLFIVVFFLFIKLRRSYYWHITDFSGYIIEGGLILELGQKASGDL